MRQSIKIWCWEKKIVMSRLNTMLVAAMNEATQRWCRGLPVLFMWALIVAPMSSTARVENDLSTSGGVFGWIRRQPGRMTNCFSPPWM